MHKLIFRAGRSFAGFFMWALLTAGATTPALAGVPYSAFVAEVESDRVLFAQNADEQRHPASLTKMMTLYLVFEALSRGQLTLETPMVASSFAVSKPPSRLGLKPGDTLTVEEGILGLVTQSANDAATVIAETLGGSEPAFAQMMTQKAQQLGMTGTVFRNAQGLPNPDQWTTARDMYKLGKALLKNYPQYYPYFATESFWFRDRSFRNHNHLLGKCPGVDGIKTGFINSSGFNLVASAKRNGARLIGVVFGGPTHARRDAFMWEILDDGFGQLEGHEPLTHVGFDTPPPPKLAPRRPVDDASDDAPPPEKKPHHHHAPKPAHKAEVEPAPKPVAKKASPAPIKLAAHEAHPAKAAKPAATHASAKPTPAAPHPKSPGKSGH